MEEGRGVTDLGVVGVPLSQSQVCERNMATGHCRSASDSAASLESVLPAQMTHPTFSVAFRLDRSWTQTSKTPFLTNKKRPQVVYLLHTSIKYRLHILLK